ncbi:MAG: hypothetical protein R3C11_26185 [Planctomycetaceae bacterium]
MRNANRKQVTLNEQLLRRDRQEDLEEESLESAVVRAADNDDGPLFPDEHYNNEVLNISSDYINVLREKAKQTVAN